MQKTVNFARRLLVFAPAALVFFFYDTLCRWAVGAMNPLAAVSISRGRQSRDAVSFSNPFEGFSLKKKDTPRPRAQTVRVEPLHPSYNVKEEFFGSRESDIVIKKENCYVKNVTNIPNSTVSSYMLAPPAFKVEKNSRRPQILIMHTHATESYLPYYTTRYDEAYSFRNTDTSLNMVAVGKAMADRLNRLGYNTVQDATLHDYPSYNGSYDNSKATVESYLEKYPSIKIVLDIHRDAVERNGQIISPAVTIDGVKYAQLMIISGADNGYMNMPNYPENLKFASRVQNKLGEMYPGLARPVLFDYRNYNQQLTTGSILVEIGSHGATLSMAKATATAFADSLAAALDSM